MKWLWSFLVALVLGYCVTSIAPMMGASSGLSIALGVAVGVVFLLVDGNRTEARTK